MIEFAYYLLKICICSGIFFLYYLIALRNKQFHQWNRFYLLIAVVLSLTVPLLQFTIWHRAAEQPNQAIELLKVVASANSYLDEVTITAHRPSSGAEWLLTGYFIISATLLFVLAVSLVKILYIIKTHAVNFISHVKFININV